MPHAVSTESKCTYLDCLDGYPQLTVPVIEQGREPTCRPLRAPGVSGFQDSPRISRVRCRSAALGDDQGDCGWSRLKTTGIAALETDREKPSKNPLNSGTEWSRPLWDTFLCLCDPHSPYRVEQGTCETPLVGPRDVPSVKANASS
jgi:hypothetical protein